MSLLAIAGAFFIVAVTPGPANIANATIAMSRGRAVSLRFGAGLSCGLAFWGLVAATGMGAVLQSSAVVFSVLKVFGGLYLLWLAWQSGKSALRKGLDKTLVRSGQVTGGRWFLRGLMLNLSNPKSVVAWMAALSVGLDSGDGIGRVALAVGVCVALGFMNNIGYSVMFSLSGVMAVYRRISAWINGVTAGLFALAGLGMIRSAFAR